MTLATESVSAAEIRERDRRYVLHPWATQSEVHAPLMVAAQGCTLWDADGKAYLDFSSQLGNVNLGFGDPRVIAAIAEQARRARVRLAAVPERAAGAPRGADRRDHARRPRQDVLHGRRQRGQRGRDPARSPLHRPDQDHHELPRLPRRHDGHAQPQRNGREQRVRAGHPRCRPRAVAGLLPVPVRPGLPRLPDRVRGAVRGADPAGEPGNRRGGDARAGARRGRRPDPTARVPPEDPRDLRPLRRAADPRRGRDRVRAHRALVRVRTLGRGARHHDDGQGPEFRVRRAGRDDRAPAAGRLLRHDISSTSATRTAASRSRSRWGPR